jgi:hypothetical protein
MNEEKSKTEQCSRTKVIDVEVVETHTESELKRLVRDLENIELEKSDANSKFNERIKEAKKALYEASHGKSYVQMECMVADDWNEGIRRYIRPDTGEVAKEEPIPFGERQQNLYHELDVGITRYEFGLENMPDLHTYSTDKDEQYLG